MDVAIELKEKFAHQSAEGAVGSAKRVQASCLMTDSYKTLKLINKNLCIAHPHFHLRFIFKNPLGLLWGYQDWPWSKPYSGV
jgi:hypothetical protein